MRFHVRCALLATLLVAMLAFPAAAAQASIGIERFVAVTCSEGHEGCAQELIAIGPPLGTFSFPKEPSKEEAEEEGFTQAGGHVPFGITAFKVTTKGMIPAAEPEGVVTHIRTDVAPGLATSPAAVPQCGEKEFGAEEALPGSGLYPEPTCSGSTLVGENAAVAYIPTAKKDVAVEGNVYNLVQRAGLASLFGVALKVPKFITEAELGEIFKGSQPGIETAQYFSHTLIEGNVEWGSNVSISRPGETGTGTADFHDFFEINVSPSLPLIASRLTFYGRSGEGDFITNATSCPGHNTTTLKLTGSEGATVARTYTTPVGLSGCNLVPFEPGLALKPATTQQDQPDGITTEVALARHKHAGEIDSAQLKEAVVQLPEGMTLNPSAATGLSACTLAQARIHSATPGVACPASSQIGTVAIEVPTLPPGSLTGNIYLGGPESGPISGPPYTIYVDAESARYGVSVRLEGKTTPNPVTGQVTTVFSELPEQPFTDAILHFKEGALAPIANPLVCGLATTESALTPYTSPFSPAKTPSSGFTVDSNGAGGACPSVPPLALTQSTQNQNGKGGGHTAYTFNLSRGDGQQYIAQVRTVLPEGLLGAIPMVTQCPEAQANSGTCPSSSQIGSATVQAGAGPAPYTFIGAVYLTGPYNGAPFGLSIVVPAIAGPFNLGNVVTRAAISVEPSSARVVVTSVLPRIVGGVPIRVKNISVSVNRSGFLFNPTDCGALATESLISGFTLLAGGITGTQSLATPFGVTECNKEAFKPTFKAASSARTSKANGASIETTINQPAGQANIKSVKVQLPLQLPSRLTTLQQACLAATFEHNPYECPKGSFVGGVRANTPTLPAKMTGPAILVSHANAAFPDLDLVLEANGVRVILVGNTDIKKGITTTTFAATPDAPVSSITVNLPIGPHSALAAYGNLCAKPLIMPTTIVGQNGVTLKQNTRIGVASCPVRIVRHRVSGNTAFVTVQAPAGGRVSGGGNGNLLTVYRHVRSATTTTIKVPLSSRGRNRGRPLRVRLRVGFVPSRRSERSSSAFVTVTFG